MAVYVDAAIWKWREMRWCHMLADDVDELHRFALSLGIARSLYQGPPRTATPHYDITAYERRLAMRRGAIACSRQEIVAVLRRIRSRNDCAKQEGPPNGSPSIVSPREAGLTNPAPTQEAQSSREARIQVTAARGVRQ